MNINAIILAAGKGTRMKSELPKPLHNLLGKPLIEYVVNAVTPLVKAPPVVVIGHGAERIRQTLGDQLRYVLQKELLGTGHAVLQAEEHLEDESGLVLVVYGDMPLVRTSTLESLIETQSKNEGPLSILTLVSENPRGFGRIVRDASGKIEAVVEEKEATPAQKEIKELNAGMYCIKKDWLWTGLKRLAPSGSGEYYLTDLVALAAEEGGHVGSIRVEDPEELIGINTRVHLAETSRILQRRINRKWMLEGVTIIDPSSTYIAPDVKIGQDTIIFPNTYLEQGTVIGKDCIIGPGSRIFKSQVGDQCEIEFSVIEESRIEDGADVGPFSHLRRGAHLGPGVHVGNFGEIKDSYLGKGSKMGHFSYIGNAEIGEDVNIGAGTITCNYDGENKHQTVIKDGVFIGSDSMLVAPLEIGENASTGAGSVVTKDVPADTVVAGVPARQIRKKKK